MLIEQIGSLTGCSLNPFQTQPSDFWLNIEFSSFNIQNIFFLTLIIYFWIKGCGHKLSRIQIKTKYL